MSRNTLIIATWVIIAASAAIVGWSFFGLGEAQPPSQSTKQSTQSSQQTTTQASSSTGPISLKNKYLRAASINYFLQGKLRETKNLPEGTELVTNIIGDGIPSFIVTDKTTIVFNIDGQQSPATKNDFKPNQTVGLAILYDLNKNTWTTNAVHIFMRSSTTTP